MKAQTVLETLTKKKNELLTAIERTPEKQIAEIDAQILNAKSQVEQDAERERLAALQVAMPKEKEAMLAVIKATQALAVALDAHAEAVRVIVGLKGVRPMQPTLLANAVLQLIDYWKAHCPEALGLPPNPSPQEMRRQEWQERIAEYKQKIEELKAAVEYWRGQERAAPKDKPNGLATIRAAEANSKIKDLEYGVACYEADLAGKRHPRSPIEDNDGNQYGPRYGFIQPS